MSEKATLFRQGISIADGKRVYQVVTNPLFAENSAKSRSVVINLEEDDETKTMKVNEQKESSASSQSEVQGNAKRVLRFSSDSSSCKILSAGRISKPPKFTETQKPVEK
jgi:hypothetical protein